MASPAIGTGTGNVQTNSGSFVTSVSVNAPTDAVNGTSLLIMAVVTGVAKTLTATGWTSIASITQTITGGGELEVFRRVHDGSSSYSVSWSGSTYVVAGIALVTGADSSPVDVSATYNSGITQSTAQTAPDVTTTVADTLLLNFYAHSASSTWSPASSQTEVFDIAVAGAAVEMTKLDVASAGATGTKTSTCSSSSGWVSMSVAIKPFTSPIKSISGVPYASVKKVSGVPIAQVKKIAGVG